MTNLEFL